MVIATTGRSGPAGSSRLSPCSQPDTTQHTRNAVAHAEMRRVDVGPMPNPVNVRVHTTAQARRWLPAGVVSSMTDQGRGCSDRIPPKLASYKTHSGTSSAGMYSVNRLIHNRLPDCEESHNVPDDCEKWVAVDWPGRLSSDRDDASALAKDSSVGHYARVHWPVAVAPVA